MVKRQTRSTGHVVSDAVGSKAGSGAKNKPSDTVYDSQDYASKPRTAAKQQWRSKGSDNRGSFMRLLDRHQIRLTLYFIVLACVLYMLRVPYADKFVELQYKLSPATATQHATYSRGPDDAYFVFFWVMLLTFIRSATMKVLHFIIQRTQLVPPAKFGRTCEQGWLFSYSLTSWSIGMWLLYNSPYWFNTREFWVGYPHRILSWQGKAYYLIQFAFWLQQIFVVQIEEKRKDYFEMLLHHIVTCILIWVSYATNFTRIGHAVLCMMDFSDILLPFAKITNYIKPKPWGNICFALFVVSWIYSRHYIYYHIVKSVYFESEEYMVGGNYEQGDYLTVNSIRCFLFLFAVLQALVIFWFWFIVRIIYRMLVGDKVQDNRSDSEDE